MVQSNKWHGLQSAAMMPVKACLWLLSRTIILMLKAYKVTISPLLGGCCRFSPSCSTYCIGAIEKHGPVKGLLLGITRLCKCHPFHSGGDDPVPNSFTWFSWGRAAKH
jgi:putative membrane protein insertion efficiency factor